MHCIAWQISVCLLIIYYSMKWYSSTVLKDILLEPKLFIYTRYTTSLSFVKLFTSTYPICVRNKWIRRYTLVFILVLFIFDVFRVVCMKLAKWPGCSRVILICCQTFYPPRRPPFDGIIFNRYISKYICLYVKKLSYNAFIILNKNKIEGNPILKIIGQ